MKSIRQATGRSTIRSAPTPELVLPDNWESLDAFVEWYLDNNMPWYMTSKCQTAVTDNALTTTVFRHKQFTVEIYQIDRVLHLNPHRHPGVDVVQMALNVPGMIWGEFFGHNWNNTTHGSYPKPNAPEVPGSFLTFGKWMEGVEPTVVVAAWDGDTFGPQHRATIKHYYPYVDISGTRVTNSVERMRVMQ